MNDYRCYFLGRDHKFKWVREFRGIGDAPALLIALQFFRSQSEFPQFELWNGARLVYTNEGSSDCSAAPRRSTLLVSAEPARSPGQ
jgi:hypothetical protein